MSNFITRTITGIGFVIILAGCILWDPYASGALFLVLSLIGYRELMAMMGLTGDKGLMITGTASGVILYAIIFAVSRGRLPVTLLLLTLLILSVQLFVSYLTGRKSKASEIWSATGGGAYVFIPFGMLNILNNPELTEAGYEPLILLGFFVLVWINDIFAYLTGRLAGKNKLFERVSPKKTWEGAIGGLLFTAGAGYLLGHYVEAPGNSNWIIIAVIVVIFGVSGDLFESWMKRKAGIKDSGSLLPGHGGVLDRFDAMLFSAPAVIFYLFLALL